MCSEMERKENLMKSQIKNKGEQMFRLLEYELPQVVVCHTDQRSLRCWREPISWSRMGRPKRINYTLMLNGMGRRVTDVYFSSSVRMIVFRNEK